VSIVLPVGDADEAPAEDDDVDPARADLREQPRV
jgi:hypothetical protein